jgi:hypothetical protein
MLEVRTIKYSQLRQFQLIPLHKTIIVLPAVDIILAKRVSEIMKMRTKQKGLLLVVDDDLRLGFIMVANLVYIKTSSRYFCYIAQDAYPGEFWLDYALETIKKTNSGLLAFNDGRFFGKVAVFGLVDRQWVNTIYKKFVFYPKYKSHFADTELSVISSQTSKLVFNPNAILVEVDYEKNLHGNNQDDENLYIERAKTGFDGLITPFIPR